MNLRLKREQNFYGVILLQNQKETNIFKPFFLDR